MTLFGRLSCLRSPGGNDWSNQGGSGGNTITSRLDRLRAWLLVSFPPMKCFSLTILGREVPCSCSVSWCNAPHDVFCTLAHFNKCHKAHLSFQILYLWRKGEKTLKYSQRGAACWKAFMGESHKNWQVISQNNKIFYLYIYFYSTIHLFKKSHQGCIYLIKNTIKAVILWNIIKKKFLFVLCNSF